MARVGVRGTVDQADTVQAPQESPRRGINGMGTQPTTSTETFDVRGGHLVAKVKELLHEGNVRRIVIKDAEGKTVLEMPVTVGLVGLLAAPSLVVAGALAAYATDYSIEVEREHRPDQDIATE
jgi:hypothetical protein